MKKVTGEDPTQMIDDMDGVLGVDASVATSPGVQSLEAFIDGEYEKIDFKEFVDKYDSIESFKEECHRKYRLLHPDDSE